MPILAGSQGSQQRIVRSGLILYWDIAVKSSYPGYGSTITDLSGSGNNGTIDGTNNVSTGWSYQTNNGGCIQFTGTNNNRILSAGPNLSSTNFTIMGAARYTGGDNERIISARYNNWLLGHWSNNTANFYSEGWVSGAGAGGADTNWRIYSGSGNIASDIYSLYVNNSLSAGPNNGGGAGPNAFAINSYGPGNSEYSNGQFSFLLAYNRVLTTDEMTQNFNYFKPRFGL